MPLRFRSAQELLPERRYNPLGSVLLLQAQAGRHRSFCLKGVTTCNVNLQGSIGELVGTGAFA